MVVGYTQLGTKGLIFFLEQKERKTLKITDALIGSNKYAHINLCTNSTTSVDELKCGVVVNGISVMKVVVWYLTICNLCQDLCHVTGTLRNVIC